LVESIDTILNNPLLLALITAIGSVVGTYFTTSSKIRKELEVELDKDLRAKRIDIYKVLWNHLDILSLFPSREIKYQDLLELIRKLHYWYFKSGIFLSEKSRRSLFELKIAILNVLFCSEEEKEKIFEKDFKLMWPDEPVDSKLRNDIVDKAHNLRNSLANDVGTRRKPILNDKNTIKDRGAHKR
jgi:hypothetical protein